MNPLLELLQHGQSFWLDNLTRGMIASGELSRRVQNEGLRGITSNPAIFNKAISGSSDYDRQIRELVETGQGVEEIYEALVVEDVQGACDALRPVYEESAGLDGYVSLEVSPYLAHDTAGTMQEARRLSFAVNRPNLFIKIPGTPEGIPAIEEMLFEGININITLLFSIESYEAVAKAYLRALERRLQKNLSVDRVASVASFFLSRIDVLVDQLLGHRIRPQLSSDQDARPEHLFGQIALANAKLAYQSFLRLFAGKRWRALEENGARVQRLLWASTSTKDPLYPDIYYVEPLIGKHTVNTMPDETVEAFSDHGRIEPDSIESGVREAKRVMVDLARTGINLDRVTEQLQSEGIQKFIDPYDQLMNTLARKRMEILGSKLNRQIFLGKGLDSQTKAALKSLDNRQISRRLFARDPYLWKFEAAHVKSIRNRLGWIDSPESFLEKAEEIEGFAREAKSDGFKHVVLLGMGGSSLCPEVCQLVFGSAPGWPELVVLDNTDPAAVSRVQSQIEPQKTLFLVASKSGTTTETASFCDYFYALLSGKGERKAAAGRHFAAITDAGSHLAKQAQERRFRHCFLNPENIGGRYSAFSYFGLVPMALIGMDIRGLLEEAILLKKTAGPGIPPSSNPAVQIGAAAAIHALSGRDKLTFLLSPSLAPFGAWVEQLVAESTGKEGKGLIPIIDEPLGAAEDYASDRHFVFVRLEQDDNQEMEARVAALVESGHSVVRIDLAERIGLGQEFYRWELATAVAGMVLGTNPFDEPDVASAKKKTQELIKAWKKEKSFETEPPRAADGRLQVYGEGLDGNSAAADELVRTLLGSAQPPEYVALLPYFLRTDDREAALQELRRQLRRKGKVATMLGYGPRYLHSTGQLHKGGPKSGVFLVLTTDSEEHLPIPDKGFDFAVLQQAQAMGDFEALRSSGQRVVRIHLGSDVESGLRQLTGYLK